MEVRSWVRFGLVRGFVGFVLTLAMLAIVYSVMQLVPVPMQINWISAVIGAVFGAFVIAGLYVLFAYLVEDVVELREEQKIIGIIIVAALVGLVNAMLTYTYAAPIVEPIQPSTAFVNPYSMAGAYVNTSATGSAIAATAVTTTPLLPAVLIGGVLGEIIAALVTAGVFVAFKWELPSVR